MKDCVSKVLFNKVTFPKKENPKAKSNTKVFTKIIQLKMLQKQNSSDIFFTEPQLIPC